MNPIPYARQDVSAADIEAVIAVLKSDFLTQGPAIPRFEKAVTDLTGAKHGVAVTNATAALHLACLAAGLKTGDRLWTSPNTFVASANCALYCGATVDFVDIDPRNYNMSVTALEKKLEEAARSKTLPKILIPVHFAGQSCEMEKIGALAKKHGVLVIEDASHAIGGSYKGRPVGSCEYSDMTVFSFHPVKIVTTGEGGLVVTNNAKFAERLQLLRSHGITRDPKLLKHKSEGPWYYEQLELGYNFRITDIQAALGMSQLARLPEFIERRRALAKRYHDALGELPVARPWQHPDSNSAWHLYAIRLKTHEVKKTHREVFEALHREGVLVNLHYIPVHLQPYYQELGFKKGQFPEAEKYAAEAVSLPMYYGLTDEAQDRVVKTLAKCLE